MTEDGNLTGPVATERALIDTGSTDTTIHPDLVKDLSLRQVGISVGEDAMTDKREPVPNYRICLTIPKLEAQWGESGDLYAPERAPDLYAPPPFRVIIGTDILQTCRFTYNDPQGGSPWLGRDRTSITLLPSGPGSRRTYGRAHLASARAGFFIYGQSATARSLGFRGINS